tara:strand:+ start:329 stop:6133 length:5805 start_codon:yes stop_codon:yes gene_type:complete
MIKIINKNSNPVNTIIVFIHGFIGNEETWVKQDGSKALIKSLLESSEIKDNFDIGLFLYQTKLLEFFPKLSSLFGKKKAVKTLPIESIGKILSTQIKYRCDEYENIILVGHSMGGLVAKRFVLDDIEQNTTSKVKLYISLATPHSGSDLATYGSQIISNYQVKDLAPLSDNIQKLNSEWVQCTNLPKRFYIQGLSDYIVPEVSGIALDREKQQPIYSDDDHFSIIVPDNEQDVVVYAIVKELKDFLANLNIEAIDNVEEFVDKGSYINKSNYEPKMTQKTLDAILLDNIYFSVGFPIEKWNELIDRNNYISQIEGYFDKGADIVFIEGEEDSGKTTLCAQYAKKEGDSVISIFFNPHNDMDYEIGFYCTNFINQAQNILGHENTSEDTFYGLEEYRHYPFLLRKYLKKTKGQLTIILDGLESLNSKQNEFLKTLLSSVPFGDSSFRIIISGEEQDFIDFHPKLKKQKSKSINLAGFSDPEIINYLEIKEVEAKDKRIKDLYKITKGLPGRLKILKRLLHEEDVSLDEISNSRSYSHWLEYDCNSIDLNDENNNKIVSLLALKDKSYPIKEIGSICSIDLQQAEKIISSTSIFEKVGDNIRLSSQAHKQYFANLLRGNKKTVDEMLVNYYASENSITSLIELPRLHANSHEWDKVINILNEDYLPRIVESTGSLKIVNESLELGIEASKSMGKHSELWRFSVQGSIVNELDNYLFWESEIKARIAIHDFTGAVSLAESAVLKIDRLRLLALIAKHQKEFNKTIDEDLIKLIQDLYDTTDLFSVGDKIFDIVADLLYAIPNLAIEIIEKSSGTTSESDINDWIITKLSIAAIDSDSKEENEIGKGESKKIEALNKLDNASAKKITKAISFLVGNYTSERLIQEVKKLSEPNEKLRLLRLWLNNNKTNINDVQIVIGIALDELVKSSSDSPINFDALKELSSLMPYIKDAEAKHKLLKRFKSLENDISELGLTKNKYIYQLNVFHTEFVLREKNWKATLNTIIEEIGNIDDTLIKLDSFAEVYSKLKTIKNEFIGNINNKIYAIILDLSKKLYNETSSHFRISSYLLKTIGNKNPTLALKICDNINSVYQKEMAKMLIIDSYLDNNLRFVKLSLIQKVEDCLEYSDTREQLIIEVLERYAEAKSLHFNTIKDLFVYTDKIKLIKNVSIRLYAFVLQYKIIVKNQEWKSKLSLNQQNLIYDTWQKIESEWDKVDNGFVVCSDLAEIDPIFAKRIFEESDLIKRNSWIDSSLVAQTYILSIKLIIKAFSGLIINKQDTNADYKTIESLIYRIPSETTKLNLWTELGLIVESDNRRELGQRILDEHVYPILVSLEDKKVDLNIVSSSLIFVHLYNPENALKYAKKSLSTETQESLYGKICYYYISKRSPFEIYEDDIVKFKADYNDITKAIQVLEFANVDNNIYYHLRDICKAIKDGKKGKLSALQINVLIESLEDLVNKKLPDPKNIKHKGYEILAKANIAIIKTKGVKHKVFWVDLLELTNNISNKSDKIYVKSVLLEEIPFEKITDGINIKSELFNDIIESLESLTVHYEFIQRVNDVTVIMHETNKKRWNEVVQKAFNLSEKLEKGKEIYNSQKRIIDSMYRLEPAFAKKLIKTIDKDSSNTNVGKLLHDHYESLEISNKIKNNTELLDREKNNSRVLIKSVVSALKSLNSDRLTPKKINEITKYLTIGRKLPLHDIFPVYIYYLSNCHRTYRAAKLTGRVKNLHVDNFREAIKATELIQLLSHRRKLSEKSTRKFFVDNEFSKNRIVQPKSREEALSFIREWMNDEVEEFVLIADPYFESEDLDILKIVKESCDEEIDVEILGSTKGIIEGTEQSFKKYWRKISDEHPPYTNVTFVWIPEKNNDTPFHDRWLITKNSGIRLGTSINSIGLTKDSELSVMKPTDSLKIQENLLFEYIKNRKKSHNNQRLAYKSFSL